MLETRRQEFLPKGGPIVVFVVWMATGILNIDLYGKFMRCSVFLHHLAAAVRGKSSLGVNEYVLFLMYRYTHTVL